MANPARALLESALRHRQLDRTLTSRLPALDRPAAAVPSGIAALDACLPGGLPRGQLSELVGPASSGRTAVLLRLAAAATTGGELAALVDTCDRFDVASAVAAGVDLDRFLWIRGEPCALERVVDRAVKAVNLILQAGGFGVVALDLADVPARTLARLPMATWLRVQRTIEGSDTACVLVVSAPLARSAGGLTLLARGTPHWSGAGVRSRRLSGLDIRVRIVSPRRRAEGDVDIRALTK